MKKNIYCAVIFFLLSGSALAADTAVKEEAKEAVNQALATLEPSGSQAADELRKAEKESFQDEDFFVDETGSGPVASVAISEKQSVASATKEQKPSAQQVTSKVVSKKPSDKIKSEVGKSNKEKTRTSADLSTAEMEARWKALFSKDITPDSILHTVKPGDSLYVLARKNHTTVDFIKKINGLTSDDIYPGMKLKIHTAPFSILVDKSQNTLVLYSNEEPVKKYSVATGKKNCTPVGKFKITDKLVNPTWFKTGAILPPGSPENGLGTRWLGFDKPSYGIHGTIEPQSIGTQASEGCIRMLNEDVEELYDIVPFGTVVTIQD